MQNDMSTDFKLNSAFMKPFASPNPLLIRLTGYPDLRWLHNMTWSLGVNLLCCLSLFPLVAGFVDPNFMARLVFGSYNPLTLAFTTIFIPFGLLGIVIVLGVPLLIAVSTVRMIMHDV